MLENGQGASELIRVRRHLVVFVVALLGGCITPVRVSQSVLDTIAVCNAGYSVSAGIDLQADLIALASGQLSSDLKLSTAIKGQFLADAKVSDARAVELYRSYVLCVQSERSIAELVAILRQRRAVLVEKLEEDGRSKERIRFDALYETYVEQVQSNQKVAAHETGREIQLLLAAAASAVQRATGTLPNYLFSEPGRRSVDTEAVLFSKRESEQHRSSAPCTGDKVVEIRDVEFVYRISQQCLDPLRQMIENALKECSYLSGPERQNCELQENTIPDP